MQGKRRWVCVWALAGWLAPGVGMALPAPDRHFPSPDWRDQIIYFLMTDRFDDGDPANNDQGMGEYDPSSPVHYHGGDLAGVARRLDYIAGLGATSVWITPPVLNQWWSPDRAHTGYHGYWARDFKSLDPHVGTLADYQRLAASLHGSGMYLVQDIVLNHTGNFFEYSELPPADDLAQGWRLVDAEQQPTRWPFTANDPRRRRDRELGAYHWTPAVRDYSDPEQLYRWQMAGLDDLATGNPVVRRALREAYGYWIDKVGVDAFRLDTIFYLPPEDVADFLHARDRKAPGVLERARRSGREDFLVFGEGFDIDGPFEVRAARRIERYMTGPDGQPSGASMIHFTLYGSLLDVMARGRPTAELADRIEQMLRVHRDPWRMPTFVDNHDVDRFLATGDEAALKQALLALMTLPGIPVIYYGTEQGMREVRPAMFAAGHGSGGRDRFDVEAPLYRFIAGATALRHAHPALRRARPEVVHGEANGAGPIAWRMRAEGEDLLVVMNTAGHPALVDHLDLGLAPTASLEPIYAIDGVAAPAQADERGRVSLELPPRAGWVYAIPAPTAAQEQAPGDESARVAIDPLPAGVQTADFAISGRAQPAAQVRLVVDGDLARAWTVKADDEGRWQSTIATGGMADPSKPHRVVAIADGEIAPRQTFRVQRPWLRLAAIADPRGDDTGPEGNYQYPADPGWTELRPADMTGLVVEGNGGALRVRVSMHSLQRPWNPPNGFDHVVFTLFVELPDQDGGATVMPLQAGELPDGMRWHYRLRVHGWTNALFAATGADAHVEGRATMPAASIAVDREAKTVEFTLPAAALGHPETLEGARVYLNTWDYGEGYRALQSEPGAHAFGGGEPGDPLWMDAIGPVELRGDTGT